MKLNLDKEELVAVLAHIFVGHIYGCLPYNKEADMSAKNKLLKLAKECGIEPMWNDHAVKFYEEQKKGE